MNDEIKLKREEPIFNNTFTKYLSDNEIIETYEKALSKFNGPGGLIKKWSVVIIIYGEIKEITFDTEEEATIAYSNIFNHDNTKDKQIYLTIKYILSF